MAGAPCQPLLCRVAHWPTCGSCHPVPYGWWQRAHLTAVSTQLHLLLPTDFTMATSWLGIAQSWVHTWKQQLQPHSPVPTHPTPTLGAV